MTPKSENHTLFSRKYPYRPNEGVPPGGAGLGLLTAVLSLWPKLTMTLSGLLTDCAGIFSAVFLFVAPF